MNNEREKDRFESRLIALEEWMMHTEHLLKQLDEVVCSLQARLDKQDNSLEKLVDLTRRLGEMQEEQRSPEDEKPPHY